MKKSKKAFRKVTEAPEPVSAERRAEALAARRRAEHETDRLMILRHLPDAHACVDEDGEVELFAIVFPGDNE